MAAGGRPAQAAIAALGEGLLEVGVSPQLTDGQLDRGYGGDAANVAVMAARLGARASLITRLGEDVAGRLLLGFWESVGVDTSAVEIVAEEATGLYVNERLPDGGHRFSYHRAGSAASELTPANLERVPVEELDALHVSGITLAISESAAATAELAVERARAAGVPVSFSVNYRAALDPDHDRLAATARAADFLFVSDDDGESLFGTRDRDELLRAIGRRDGETILTRGGEPAWVGTAAGAAEVVPPRVEVVDTAGAGDALTGAYVVARLAGAAPREALGRGVAAASLSCERSGCARGYPSAAEVEAAWSRVAGFRKRARPRR
jgi:2-dehydro-3-deoxygluconokinase